MLHTQFKRASVCSKSACPAVSSVPRPLLPPSSPPPVLLLQSIDSNPTDRSTKNYSTMILFFLPATIWLNTQSCEMTLLHNIRVPRKKRELVKCWTTLLLVFLLVSQNQLLVEGGGSSIMLSTLMFSTSMMLVEAGCTSRVGRCLGQLGAGTGFQSCAAPPFRATRWSMWGKEWKNGFLRHLPWSLKGGRGHCHWSHLLNLINFFFCF